MRLPKFSADWFVDKAYNFEMKKKCFRVVYDKWIIYVKSHVTTRALQA